MYLWKDGQNMKPENIFEALHVGLARAALVGLK